MKRISVILDVNTYNSVAKYIDEIAAFYQKQRYDECKVFLIPYLANGYFYIGDMESLKLMLDIGMGDKNNLNYCYLYTCYTLEIGDLTNAEKALNKFNKVVNNMDGNSTDYVDFFEKYQICKMMLEYYRDKTFNGTLFWKSLYEKEKKN